MQRISLVNIAHNFIKEHLNLGDIAIDATVGNGHDTLFLAQQVGALGLVFGFDIQPAAIEATQQKFRLAGMNNLTLIEASHATMSDNIPLQYHGKINTIMFNLGYLPGGNKTIITRSDSTLTALTNACQLLSDNGIITIMAYPGHTGGDLETDSVSTWCEHFDKHQFTCLLSPNPEDKPSAPKLFIIQKHT
jgi:predicted methyltransferase